MENTNYVAMFYAAFHREEFNMPLTVTYIFPEPYVHVT